jgi:hypothetical protein
VAAPEAPPRVWGGVQERGENGDEPANLTRHSMLCRAVDGIDPDQSCKESLATA